METIAWPGPGFQHLLNRATSMIEKCDRSILAVAGAPGSGKSTLAGELLLAVEERYPGQVALVGMDGFHLAQRVLDTTGWAAVKGAPQTFDANGYIDLLQRIHAHPGRRIYAPEFRREIEDSIAHAVVISPDVRLVITEGNYLLLDEEPWARVRPLLDEAWFIHLDDPERRRRLSTRHRSFGLDDDQADQKTWGSDEQNAQLVNGCSLQPDVWIEHLS